MSDDLSKEIEKLKQLDASLEDLAVSEGAELSGRGAEPAAPYTAGSDLSKPDAAREAEEIAVHGESPAESMAVPGSPHNNPIPGELQESRVPADYSSEPQNVVSAPVRPEGVPGPADTARSGKTTQSDDGDDKVMTVIEHLGELRTRLFRCVLMFVGAFFLAFYFGKEVITFLEVPAGPKMTFITLSLEEPLMVQCKVSFYGALVLVAPYLILEAALFIAPGLRRSERRILSPIVFGGPLLFLLGGMFCYYLVLPPMLSFFSSFGAGNAPVQQRLDFYISLVTSMLFYMGLCFQLPVVLFALSLAGLVNSRMLLRMWRYSLVGSSIVAAIITPDPTIFSMLVVWGGLIGLYFGTIVLLKVFGR